MMRLAKPLPLILLLIWATTTSAAPRIIPKAPSVAAKAYILMDADSGHIITEGNSHERLAPASLTKIMTSYAIFSELRQGNITLEDEVTISEKAWRTGGSKMFIEVGKKIQVKDLMNGMIISSGNDASVALAEHIGGAEETFAQLMNQYAEILGMKNSHFENATGMPADNHYTSATDMAILSQALIRDFPEYYPIYAEKEFIYGKELKSGKPIKQKNRNKLLWRDESVDGLKTGYTKAAGYCLVASAKREEMRLISAVLGTKSTEARAQETQKLLNFGFRFYETQTLATPEQPLENPPIWKGAQDQIKLGVAQPLTVTLGRNQFKELQSTIALDNPTLEAPIQQGTALGSITYTVNGEPLVQAPLVALESIEEGSLWNNLKDSVMMYFN
jgi:D-alanyl-D-alanine carboxypeptidase (penicillin-binding protein 5/6)